MSQHADREWTPLIVPGANTTTVGSADGVTYTLKIFIPEAPPPPNGFPLLVALDGENHFLSMVAAAKRLSARPDATGVRPMVVAAIESFPPQSRRFRDFTPWPPERASDRPDSPYGEAAAFTTFLEDIALPMILRMASINQAECALFGHSLSGYFALYAATRLHAFQSIAAISPSIWWHESRLEEVLRGADLSQRRFFISVGDREAHSSRLMIARAEKMAKALADASLDIEFLLAPNEDHGSTPLATMPAMMRFLMRPNRPTTPP